jgi:retron-type reverse transcriptase
VQNLKRHGQLFQTIFTREALFDAYLQARKGKRMTPACFSFERNLGGNIAQLLDEIHGGLYRPRPYRIFKVYEPKVRDIHAPAFRDRVVQHAIYKVIYPLFDRSFLVDSCACRVGFGTHRASEALHRSMQQLDGEDYFLQLDIRKFFYSIDRQHLRGLIERKIKDNRLIDLMMLYADDCGPVGIPIGNLLSQLFALIYLNYLDHYIKRGLGVKHYVRYVDDFVLLGLTRAECLEMRGRIIDFLADNLKLTLSKSTIQKISHGINFVGYRHWRSHKIIRKHSIYRFRRNLKAGRAQAIISTFGHAMKTASLPYLITIIKESDHGENLQLPDRFRRLHHLPRQPARGRAGAGNH